MAVNRVEGRQNNRLPFTRFCKWGFVAVIRNITCNTDDDAGTQTGSPARPSLGRNDRISSAGNITVLAHSSQSKTVCVRNVICAV